RNAKGGKRGDGKTQAYTWAACIMVLVFAVSIAASVKGAGKKNDSQEAYRKQAFDLGNMPFSDDSAEAYLLASNKYNDIAKNSLINGLFSKEQKEERQESDALNGVPAAPDKEYEAAREEQAAKRSRSIRPATKTPKKQAPTRPSGTLSSGSMATTSGGGGGSRGTVWGSGNKGVATGGGSKMQPNQAALINQVKNGKGMGFQHAAMASAAAANAKDMESAAANAVDAFQKGATEVGKDVLESDLEKSSDALNVDEADLRDKLERAGNSDELSGLDNKLEDLKKKKDDEDKNENCEANGAFSSGACFANSMMGLGKMILSAYIGSLF
ncbi:MAG: hypothetical protein ACI352_07050, partial [Elusimicrobiaceae bacterium]